MVTRMTQKPIFKMMDLFDPVIDNWPVYPERLEQFFLANGIENEKKVAVLLTIIGTKPYTVCTYVHC